MLDNGWGVEKDSGDGTKGWVVYGSGGYKLRPIGATSYFFGPTPIEAILKAKKWYQESKNAGPDKADAGPVGMART